MTTTTQAPPPHQPANIELAEPEPRGYAKDYWDLVLEQLGRRTTFKIGMLVLAILYGLAIFAPLLANDRPLRLNAVDLGGYNAALKSMAPVTRQALELAGREGSSESQIEAELSALRIRAQTLQTYLVTGDAEPVRVLLADVEAAAREGGGNAEALVERAMALRESHVPASVAGSPVEGSAAAQGVVLQPSVSYPLTESLGPRAVFFIALWILCASFPFWNRLWNQVGLGGDRDAARKHRRLKWLVLLGTPSLVALAWAFSGLGGSAAFDVAHYKQGLTEGTIVPAEAPLLAPIPIGYAETHKEEGFRPPTYLESSRVDSNGRYLKGPRRMRPDPVTGYMPPPTPVEVRFGEPWPNDPLRHPLGTDELGRDFLVRLLWGGRVSLAVGIISAFLLTVIGVFMGSLAGYFGGWVDIVIMRVIEILQAVPAFFLILATMAFIPAEVISPIFAIVIVIALVRWTGAARLVRGEFLRLRDQEFVLAAKSLGFPNRRTIFRHVLPNAMGPVLVSAAFAVASGILTESAVSFLGFGVKHPEASWGSLVNESKSADHWWVQVFPGLLIFLTVTCYNLVGDAVRDALDPKMKV